MLKVKQSELKKQIQELKTAIAAKCLDCVCLQIKEVQGCEIKDCALHSLRPIGGTGLRRLKEKLKKHEAKL